MLKYLLIPLFVLWTSSAAATGTVILLADISSSISQENLNLQLDSYAAAMTSVGGLYSVHVEAIVFDNVPVLISSGTNVAAATAFAAHPRLSDMDRGSTCLADALLFVEARIPDLPQPVVLDISGDGEANCTNSDSIPATLDRIAALGVQINTLFINSGDDQLMAGPDFLDPYSFYQTLTRNDGFTMLANGFMEFELSLFDKLTLELAFLQ